MQSSESKAWLPRQVAKQLAQSTVDRFNEQSRNRHPRQNKTTGLVLDRTGMFIVETKKKRRVEIPA